MKKRPFDNLPPLTQEKALDILSTPIHQLSLSSDYYKAVFHLEKYPGEVTEDALLNLLKLDSGELPIAIAKRKAVEVLAILDCDRSIPSIGICLNSEDTFLVASAAWALSKLNCKDTHFHRIIASKLHDGNQNQRLLVQSLAKMRAFAELSSIETLLEKTEVNPGIRGACIAAIVNFKGKSEFINELKDYLILPNQNDRQCAAYDVINSGQISLLPYVLKAPIAPSFKMLSVEKLWPISQDIVNGLDLYRVIDSLVNENPKGIECLHTYDFEPDIKFLIKELFGVDFSRCYLALNCLVGIDPTRLWPYIDDLNHNFKKDYGALYFLIILFIRVDGWQDQHVEEIERILLHALDGQWPDFMKFKPIAIIALMHFRPDKYKGLILSWLDENKTPFWASRYAALMTLETSFRKKGVSNFVESTASIALSDNNRFVKGKARTLFSQ